MLQCCFPCQTTFIVMHEIVLMTSDNPRHRAKVNVCACLSGGGGESLPNSLEANEKGNSGKGKKRCNPWNTRVLDINKHAGRISKGRLLAGNPLMCWWEIRTQTAVQRGMNAYRLRTHTHTQRPSLSCVIRRRFGCLFTGNFPCHQLADYIHTDAGARSVTMRRGTFPLTLLPDKLNGACLVLQLENICQILWS